MQFHCFQWVKYIFKYKPISYLYNNHDVVGDYYFSGNNKMISSFFKRIRYKYPIKRNEKS